MACFQGSFFLIGLVYQNCFSAKNGGDDLWWKDNKEENAISILKFSFPSDSQNVRVLNKTRQVRVVFLILFIAYMTLHSLSGFPRLYNTQQDSFSNIPLCPSPYSLQLILDLCISEIELANTRSQISFIYFQSHSWNSVRNY